MSRADREQRIVDAVLQMVRESDEKTRDIKKAWKESRDLFVNGSVFKDKEEWQSNLSLNIYASAIRVTQGELVNTLVNVPDWFQLKPKSPNNQRASVLQKPFKKLMDYYLDTSKFKRHAGTFMMNSLISIGSLHVGWTSKLIQNPEYVAEKSRKMRQEDQARLAKNVANPMVEETSGDDLAQAISEALDQFTAMAQGETMATKEIPPYLQVGTPTLIDPIDEQLYWDPFCSYLEESPWKAFEYDVPRYELNRLAKLGYFKKSKVKQVGELKEIGATEANQDRFYRNLSKGAAANDNRVKLLVYYGPLVIDQEPVKDNFFCVIANRSVLLKAGECPYWLPPSLKTPVISTAVRQIPHRATGAGIGDNARDLQRTLDSNWNMVVDQFRFAISGINIVDRSSLVDKSQLDEGIAPGAIIEIRNKKPSEVFERIDLTSNLESQVSPVQNRLERAIQEQLGVNDLQMGGNNPYSRTSAAETEARVDGSKRQVNIAALDLEQNFLLPTLQMYLALIVQFGLLEINSNPEIRALLDEDELMELSQLTEADRMDILGNFYLFKIKGFSDVQDTNLQLQRYNELLQIINSGGPLSQLINLPEFMKGYFEVAGVREKESLLITEGSLLEKVACENKLLIQGIWVQPGPNDNHEFELQSHSSLPPNMMTPALQQHIAMHQQALQQMQMPQQQGPGQGQPPQGPPVQ